MFDSKSRPLIGLDVSSSAVKMVELADAGNGSYRLERYATESLARDVVGDGNITNHEAVTEAIRNVWKKMGTSIKNVAMALPTAAVISKKIMVSAGQRDQDLEAMVESEASQYIPFALDEVNLDFQVLGAVTNAPEDVEVLIAASRKEKVVDRVAVAEAAGLKAIVMDVESYAAQSAFELVERQLPDAGRNKVIALVDIGANVTNVTVMRNDQPIYSREQVFGGYQLTQEIVRQYGMTAEEAENAKRTGTLPENYEEELLRPFMDSLAMEVSRALQFFFTSTQYNNVDYIALAGGCAAIPRIDEVVAGRTQVSTIIANPFADMALSQRVRPKNLAIDAPSLMVACGLALRRFDQ